MECEFAKENKRLSDKVRFLGNENKLLRDSLTNLNKSFTSIVRKPVPIAVISSGRRTLRIFTSSENARTVGRLRATIQEFMGNNG